MLRINHTGNKGGSDNSNETELNLEDMNILLKLDFFFICASSKLRWCLCLALLVVEIIV